MNYFPIVLTLFASLSAAAQYRHTTCQTVAEPTAGGTPAQRLIGCGEGFPENVLWHLDRADSSTGAFDGRSYTPATGNGVVVYVIDLSIRADHYELTRAGGSIVIATKDVGVVPRGCGSSSTSCSVGLSHGTSVASVIAGQTVGIAPDVELVSIIAGPADYREALRAVVQHAYSPTAPPFRTAVVNISGGYTPSFTQHAELAEDVRRMTSGVDPNMNPDPNGKRFVIAVAAGNAAGDGLPNGCAADGTVIAYPGLFGPSIDGLITVGAITRDNQVWSRSCRGSAVEVLAPGANVFLASGGGVDHYFDPAFVAGTSFSTPYVAGMAARILEREPNLTPAQVEARIKASPSRVDGLPVPVMAAPSKRRAVRQLPGLPAPRSVMWIAAHPDDEAVAAPLLARWCIEDEARCAFLVLTRGETGECLLPRGCHPDIASVRSAEAAAAAQLFGAESIQLDFPDGGGVSAPVWNQAADAILSHIEAFRPQLILTFDARHGTTGHPDHRETGRLVLESVERLSYEPAVYLLETEVTFAPDPFRIFFFPACPGVERFDATQTWSAIVEDMQRHPSQFDAQWIAAIQNVPVQDRAVYIAPAARASLAACP